MSHLPRMSQALYGLIFVFVFVLLLVFVSRVYFGVWNNLIAVSHLPRECRAPYGLVFVFAFVFLFILVSVCFFGVWKDLIRVSRLPRESHQAPYGLVSQPNHLSLHTGHWTPLNTGQTI